MKKKVTFFALTLLLLPIVLNISLVQGSEVVYFTITATSIGNGYIYPGTQDVEQGGSITENFIPDVGYHISAIKIDDHYLGTLVDSYEFSDVQEDHTITVWFSPVGEATVPEDDEVTVFLTQDAIITFYDTEGGIVEGEEVTSHPFIIWEITAEGLDFSEAMIALRYDDNGDPRLIKGKSIYDIRCDVNNDQEVNSEDTSIVAEAKITPGRVRVGIYEYDPVLDINNDLVVDNSDKKLVNKHKGAILEDITEEVVGGVILSILVTDFSFYAIR